MPNYLWKKGLLSSTYRLFEGDQQLGELKDKTFSYSSQGLINNKNYRFKNKGIFKPVTQIIDTQQDKVIGEIRFSNWMYTAEVTLGKRKLFWNYTNWTQTKWRLTDRESIHFNYTGSTSGGRIEASTEDDLLLLTGLYVTNYYSQIIAAVLVAVMIPLFASGT